MTKRENRIIHLLLCMALIFSLSGFCLADEAGNSSGLDSGRAMIVAFAGASSDAGAELRSMNAFRSAIRELTECSEAEEGARYGTTARVYERSPASEPPDGNGASGRDRFAARNRPLNSGSSPLLKLN